MALRFPVILLFLSLSFPAFSQTIRGSVTDKVTGQPLVGASVVLPELQPQLALDLQNMTSRENVAFRYYDALQGRIIDRNQLGIIPVLSYRVEF